MRILRRMAIKISPFRGEYAKMNLPFNFDFIVVYDIRTPGHTVPEGALWTMTSRQSGPNGAYARS